jgi:hypothetical protein
MSSMLGYALFRLPATSSGERRAATTAPPGGDPAEDTVWRHRAQIGDEIVKVVVGHSRVKLESHRPSRLRISPSLSFSSKSRPLPSSASETKRGDITELFGELQQSNFGADDLLFSRHGAEAGASPPRPAGDGVEKSPLAMISIGAGDSRPSKMEALTAITRKQLRSVPFLSG